MAKRTVYTCDVCGKELEKAAPVHITCSVGKNNPHADVCSPKCGTDFVEQVFKSKVSGEPDV